MGIIPLSPIGREAINSKSNLHAPIPVEGGGISLTSALGDHKLLILLACMV